MRVSALDPSNPVSLKRVLVRAGLDPVRADALLEGSATAALFVSNLTPSTIHDLLLAARDSQVDSLSGDDWVLLSGSIAHLAGLTRPGHTRLSDELSEHLGVPLRGLTDPVGVWQTAAGPVSLDRPIVVGVLNVTPDSFSDGGEFLEAGTARRRAEELVAEGADILEVGGHSTKPGAEEVPVEEEWSRLAPVLDGLAALIGPVPISVDTYRAEIGRRAIDHGAAIINDVSGFRFDSQLPAVCAAAGVGVALMHSRGDVTTMASYDHAEYDDVVFDVADELRAMVHTALNAGITRESIVVDPGLGFGKHAPQNHELLARLSDFAPLGFPVMVGPSRKRFVRELTGSTDLDRLDEASAQICLVAATAGARLFRVHRADIVRRALDIAAVFRES